MDIASTTDLLALLSDPTRVRALALLSAHEMSAAELLEALGGAQSRMSSHLSRLKAAGMLRERRAGSTVYLQLDGGALAPAAAAVWDAVRGGLSDAQLQQDMRAAEAVIRARGATRGWTERVAGEMEKHYSPGRTWESLARGLAVVSSLGDVLDVGSGDGTVAQLLCGVARSYTLLDHNAHVLDAARGRLRGAPRVELVTADAEELPWAAPRFDQVFLFNVLTDVAHPARAIQEAARVLRPQGVLGIITLGAHGALAQTAAYGHVHAGFSPVRLRRMLVDAGLTVESCAVTSREKRTPRLEVVTARAQKPANKARKARP
jgi:DNA-binding transcriptional ArsR family regulator